MILNGETPGKIDDDGNILGDEMNDLQIVVFQSDGILDDYSLTPPKEDRTLDIEIHDDEMDSLQIIGFQSDEIYTEDKN
jgi:hypothetical protein